MNILYRSEKILIQIGNNYNYYQNDLQSSTEEILSNHLPNINLQKWRIYSKVISDILFINVIPRVYGGKGGFGSMLRKIGSQIEKTTNRESCRDLEGRRLHNINFEKRLTEHLKKKKEKDNEETTIKKLVFNHKFNDEEYFSQREIIKKDHSDAISKGLKRNLNKENENNKVAPKKKKSIFDIEEFNDAISSDSSDDESQSKSVELETKHEFIEESIENPFVEQLTETQPKVDTILELSIEETNDTTNKKDCVTENVENNKNLKLKDNDKHSKKIPIPVIEPNSEFIASFNLDDYKSASHLSECVDLHSLKVLLQKRNLKCGGTKIQRADRLYSIKDLEVENYPKNILAKK
ncbi:hypothetical protein A3Q56_06366 [Intoshia linei]|uniref:Uncharacterized protein n=1 Tax=Intoshia linei TaxID=1819745 RepID=A0A177AV72_9BILA|nr:hypothetical protein A3Q56_06366 [Intoshia linei]